MILCLPNDSLKKVCALQGQTKDSYHHDHNIMIIFYVLPNFPFTTSETKLDYY